MDQILAQVSRAQRRLWLELFLNRALTCLFATLALAVVAITVPKFVVFENLPSNWTALCAVAGVVGGVLAALVWTLARGLSTLDAAVELDNRFDLRERVSSSLAISPDDAATPAGQALLSDAARAIKRVEVSSRFGITLPRRKWLPVLSTAIAFVLLSFVGNPTAQSSVDPQAAAHAKEQRDNVSKNLKKRLVERKKQAAAKGLKETAGLFDQLEKETEKLRKNPEADQKQSLVKLNDLAKQLEKRRGEVGNKDAMRKQLSNLDKLNRGPAEKMAEAMKEGDWQKALEELKSLQEQIKTDKLSEEQKKALEEQLKKIQEKLVEAQRARDQSMDELKKQIQKQQEQGNHAQAGEMQQKLEQMQAQQSQMDKLQGLASKMGEAQQAMKQGDMQKASEAMDQMVQQMESLDQAMKEGEMLDAAMAEMQAAKEAMACQECSGQGCETCQSNAKGTSNQQAKKGGGSGMGKGTAWGQRDDSNIDAKFRDSRVKQETGQGPLVYAGEADGPNIRGKVSAAVQTEMAAEGTSPTDPQLIDELPKSRREHAEEYFDLFREGR